MRFAMIGILAAALATPALAADEHRLSPAEVEKILEAAAVKNAAVPAPPTPPRPIQGEVGVSIGSDGTREAFGTAIMPVGEDGIAIISIDGGDSGRPKRRH